MQFLSLCQVWGLLRCLHSEKACFVLFDGDVLALKPLLLLCEVTLDVRWQLLGEHVEESSVAERIFAIGKLSKRVFQAEGEGPLDAVRGRLDLHDARFEPT